MLDNQTVSQSKLKQLASLGYSIREQWGQHYLISWKITDHSSPDFSGRIAQINALLPDATIDIDFQFSACDVVEGESYYPYSQDDHMDIQWLFNNGYDAEGIIIAVLDSGIKSDHPDLSGQFLGGYDFVDNDQTTYDPNNHGSKVSAIINANGRNGMGMAGLAPNSKILPIRVLDRYGNGWTSNGIKGIDYAKRKNADVINASWGGLPIWNHQLEYSIKAFITSGGVFVCAAGNEGLDLNISSDFPASFNLDGMIVVGGLFNNFQNLYWDSNFGDNIVDILAPWTWIVPDFNGDVNAAELTLASGTSISTPIVSAFVAIAKANFSEPNALQLVNRVVETGILSPGTCQQAEHPGYPNFIRLFENFRPSVPAILSYTLDPNPPIFGDPSRIFFEVAADSEYIITNESTGTPYDASTETVSVINRSGTLFNYRISGINGFSTFGPFRVYADDAPPSLENPPPPFIEIPADDISRRIYFTPTGSRPITVSYNTEIGYSTTFQLQPGHKEFSVPVPELPPGKAQLTLTNTFGEYSITFEPTWHDKVLVPPPPDIDTALPFGEYLLAKHGGLAGNLFLFDGNSFTPFISDFDWDEDDKAIGFRNGFPVFHKSNTLVEVMEDGSTHKTPFVWESGHDYIGTFEDKFLFRQYRSLKIIEPTTGTTEIIPFPFDGGKVEMISYTNTELLLRGWNGSADSDYSVWKLGPNRQWTELPEVEPIMRYNFYSTSRYFFQLNSSNAADRKTMKYSHDGLSWFEREVPCPPNGGKPFIYDDGLAYCIREIGEFNPYYSYYACDLEKNELIPIVEDVPGNSQMDGKKIVSVGKTLTHGPYKFFNGVSYLPSWPHMEWYYTTPYGYYGSTDRAVYFSKDLDSWSPVMKGTGGVSELDGECVLIHFSGTYIIHEDTVIEQIGEGFPGGDFLYTETVGGEMFAKRESGITKWYVYDPILKKWSGGDITSAACINNDVYTTTGSTVYKGTYSNRVPVFSAESIGVPPQDYPGAYVADRGDRIFVYLKHRRVTSQQDLFFESKDGLSWDQVERDDLFEKFIKYSVGKYLYFYDNNTPEGWTRLDKAGNLNPIGEIEAYCLNLRPFWGVTPIKGYRYHDVTKLRDREVLSPTIYSVFPNAAFSGTSGWFMDEDLGWIFFMEDHPSYIYSMSHGWLYVSGDIEGGYLYDTQLGWLFYSRKLYPNLYQYATSDWLMYLEGSNFPRWFWSTNSLRWISF